MPPVAAVPPLPATPPLAPEHAAFNSQVPGDFENNLLYATGTDANGHTKTPFPNGASLGSFNACGASQSCGTSSQVVADASFVSLDPNDPGFLKPASGASPIDHGTTLNELTTDYAGNTRPSGAYDIGAFEAGN